jgi:choline-sulfatase
MVSYIDYHVGRLLSALEATGLADNTVVVFTADHGDMMGERGMWYKFNPFEWSVRVPLIVRAPGNAKGRREAKSVSLVDLLPTLLDLATDGSPTDLVEPVDGHSWSGMLHGEDDSRPDEAMVEFTAEGAIAPCLILRKGPYKYVYSEPDPGMLFNVENDPGEQVNLCGNPEHAAVEQEMLADILGRWDPQEIKQDIIESQQRRHFIQGVMMSGRPAPWDYQPLRDASHQYLRSGGSPTMVKGLARFPYMEPVPPDFPRT